MVDPREAKWVFSERLMIAEIALVVTKKLCMGHTREVTRSVSVRPHGCSQRG